MELVPRFPGLPSLPENHLLSVIRRSAWRREDWKCPVRMTQFVELEISLQRIDETVRVAVFAVRVVEGQVQVGIESGKSD